LLLKIVDLNFSRETTATHVLCLGSLAPCACLLVADDYHLGVIVYSHFVVGQCNCSLMHHGVHAGTPLSDSLHCCDSHEVREREWTSLWSCRSNSSHDKDYAARALRIWDVQSVAAIGGVHGSAKLSLGIFFEQGFM
jgi:hypothetical protein